MDWPSSSPDLNPIENVWSILKQRVHSGELYLSIDSLKETIQRICEDPEMTSICQSVIESMPKRIMACLAAKGGLTKY